LAQNRYIISANALGVDRRWRAAGRYIEKQNWSCAGTIFLIAGTDTFSVHKIQHMCSRLCGFDGFLSVNTTQPGIEAFSLSEPKVLRPAIPWHGNLIFTVADCWWISDG